MRAIICVAGGIASGKTQVATALMERLPGRTVIRSFGDVVRARAQAEGLPADRSTLQELGLRLIEEGWSPFVDRVLADLPSSINILIVEGVRHAEPVAELRRRFPNTNIYLVYLESPPDTVKARLAERDEAVVSMTHLTEAHHHLVKQQAHLVIDFTATVDETARRIEDYIDEHR